MKASLATGMEDAAIPAGNIRDLISLRLLFFRKGMAFQKTAV